MLLRKKHDKLDATTHIFIDRSLHLSGICTNDHVNIIMFMLGKAWRNLEIECSKKFPLFCSLEKGRVF